MPEYHKSYGDAEGPLGFPMVTEAARELEALLKELDVDCKSLLEEAGDVGIIRLRVAPTKFELLEGERADISLVTTDAVDRDREVVLPQGGNWKTFQKGGGIVTFAHKYDELPIGRSLWMKRVTEPENGWLAKTQYKTRPKDWEGAWFPDAVFSFVQNGMRGKSIGFIPLKLRRPAEEDVKKDPRMAEVRFIISKWMGLEYAVAPVQSNPDAVTIAVSKMRQKGEALPPVIMSELEAEGLIIPDAPAKPEPVPENKALTHASNPADEEPAWGGLDKKKLPRSAHADTGETDKKSTWKFPHHWVSNGGSLNDDGVFTTGDMHLHKGGLNAAWSAAQGGRTGQEASAAVKSHLQTHRKALGLKDAERRVIAPEDAVGSRTPEELTKEMQDAALAAADSVRQEIPKIAEEEVNRMQGKI